MLFGNINFLTIFLFILLLFFGIIVFYYLNKKNNSIFSLLILFFSFFFLNINIFDLKLDSINDKSTIKGGKVVFVLDVSKSMNVLDIYDEGNNRSRLLSIKNFISDFTFGNITNHYGLMIFAGVSMDILPIINDIEFYNSIIYGVNENNVSKYGTNLNSVFLNLDNYFIQEDEGGLVVIFTDGGDEDIIIDKTLTNSLKNRGIKIILVGVGTTNGGKIPIGNDFFEGTQYKIYEGQEVISSINDNVLSSISKKHGFTYFSIDNYSNFNNLSSIIKNNLDLIDLEYSISNGFSLTRFFVFISFVLFIIFVTFEYFLGKRK